MIEYKVGDRVMVNATFGKGRVIAGPAIITKRVASCFPREMPLAILVKPDATGKVVAVGYLDIDGPEPTAGPEKRKRGRPRKVAVGAKS